MSTTQQTDSNNDQWYLTHITHDYSTDVEEPVVNGVESIGHWSTQPGTDDLKQVIEQYGLDLSEEQVEELEELGFFCNERMDYLALTEFS